VSWFRFAVVHAIEPESRENFELAQARNVHRVVYSTRIVCDCGYLTQLGLFASTFCIFGSLKK